MLALFSLNLLFDLFVVHFKLFLIANFILCFTFAFVKGHSRLWKVLYKSKELSLFWTHSLVHPQCSRFVWFAFSPLPHNAAVGAVEPAWSLPRRCCVSPAGSECPKPRREAPEAAWRMAAGNETAVRGLTTTKATTPRSRTHRTQVGGRNQTVVMTAVSRPERLHILKKKNKTKRKSCVSAVVCVPSARSRLDSRLQGLQRDGVANPRRVGQLAGGCSWGAGNRLGQLHRVPTLLRVS